MIDFALIVQSIPALLKGVLVTLCIAGASCGIGLILGTFLGASYLNSSKWIRTPVAIYITFFRGTPMLIQIMFVFYVLPELGIHLTSIWSAILAIGLNSAAYISQTVRTGINSIPIGQIEGARSLGMSKWQIKRYVIAPQVFQVILPSLGNELITLIKDSSLASIIGVMELSKEGSIIRSQTYDAFTILIAVSCIYLLMTSTLSFILKVIKDKGVSYVRT